MHLLWDIALATQLQLLCDFFWLQDHSAVTRMCQKQEMVRGWLGICHGGRIVCGIQNLRWYCAFWRLLPDHVVGAFSQWESGGWRWTGSLEPPPVPRWGDFIPVHSPVGKLYLQIPVHRLRCLGRLLSTHGVCARTGCSCAVSPQILSGTWLPFQSIRFKEAWAKLYALSPQCSPSPCLVISP
jgi:hypothetical protein